MISHFKQHAARYITSIFILAFYIIYFFVGSLSEISKYKKVGNTVFIFLNIFILIIINYELLKAFKLIAKKTIFLQIISYFSIIILYLLPNSIDTYYPYDNHFSWLHSWLVILIYVFIGCIYLLSASFLSKNVRIYVICEFFLMILILYSFKSIRTMMLFNDYSSHQSLYHFGWISVLFILSITVITDTFAFIGGIIFGKHKLAFTISPNKTWEGAIIGTTVATLIVYIAIVLLYFFLPKDLETKYIPFFALISSTNKIVVFIIYALFIFALSIISQFGDLFFSWVKRNLYIKDFSNILPGHGGILDRLDSFIIASSAAYGFIHLMLVFFSNNWIW